MSYLILGGGSVVAEFYLPALTMLGLSAQTTVVDPFERSLAPIRAAFPDVRCVQMDHVRALQALPAGGSERVVVALPNALHVEAVELALQAGRHVLCEKPLALRAADCARLARQAEAVGRRLKAAMSRRYLASLTLARQMVLSHELGGVIEVEVRDCSLFLWRPRSFAFFAPDSGGVLADMGVHYLDFVDTIVGPMSPVDYQDDARGGTESSAIYRLKAGDVPISLTLSRIYSDRSFVRIVCERGEIRADKSLETGVTVTPLGGRPRLVSAIQPFDQPAWPLDFHGSFCQMLADFEREIAGQQTPIADVRDAERATALIECAYQSRGAPRPARIEGRAEVVVTGATGFIGGHLVQRLTREGQANVRVTARSPASCANVSRFPVEIQPTDLTDSASVGAAVQGAKTVYHLAYGKERDAPRITIEGTKAVVEAAIAAGVECVVVLSTMYVFGFPGGSTPVDESFPYRPYGGEYANSKAEMERWCLDRAKTSGATRIVVINPTCVFGPDGGAYTTLPLDLVKMGQFCWIEDGQGDCNYTYVENVVDALLAAASTPAAHGERFIINDGTSTWKAFFEPWLKPLNAAIPSYTVQEFKDLPRYGGAFRMKELVSAIVSSEKVRAIAKRSPVLRGLFESMSRAAAKRGGEHLLTYRWSAPAEAEAVFPPPWLADLFPPFKARFCAEKATRILGWTPSVGLAEAQAQTEEWLRQTGRLPARAERDGELRSTAA